MRKSIADLSIHEKWEFEVQLRESFIMENVHLCREAGARSGWLNSDDEKDVWLDSACDEEGEKLLCEKILASSFTLWCCWAERVSWGSPTSPSWQGHRAKGHWSWISSSPILALYMVMRHTQKLERATKWLHQSVWPCHHTASYQYCHLACDRWGHARETRLSAKWLCLAHKSRRKLFST